MSIPLPDAALAQHIAVVGKTGSGKSSTSRLIVEHVAARGLRVCVLDPIKSDWWGITSSADGKRPGLPFYILGGPRGHVPLHEGAGKAIGDLVGSGQLPLSIIDMADFKPGGLQRFFIDFAESLFKRIRGVVYLVIEEAHEFAPKERAGIGDENYAIHWAKKLAAAGRSKGIRLIVVTQRTQSLHNALLGSCETLSAHRLTLPADQKPIVDWLKANVDKATVERIAGSLASLRTGSGWICSGEARIAELVQFPRFTTYDNTATPTGDEREHAVQTAPVDQERLRAIVGDALKEAEADDPKALKARIAELEKRLAEKVPAIDPQAVADAEQRGYQKGFAGGRREAYQRALQDVLNVITTAIEGIRKEWASETFAAQPPPVDLPKPAENMRGSMRADAPAERLPIGERKILTALAQYPAGLAREQLSVLTDYKRSSRDAYIQRLRERGYAAIDGDRVKATPEGIAALGPDFEPLPTGAALRAYWINRLPEGERRVLEVVIAAYPRAVERPAIDERTGYKRSSRDAYIQRLKARQLVVIQGRSKIRASDALFGE